MNGLRELRPHQANALAGLKDSLRSGRKRPMLQLPTGAGKTVVAAHIVAGALAKNNRVAFVVPMLNLIDQTFERFMENGINPGDMGVMQGDHDWRRPHAPVQICSIQTVAKRGFPDAPIVVVDEAHLRFEAMDRWMQDRAVRFIGLSATPWARGLGKSYDDLISPITMAELVAQGYLSPFRVFSPTHPNLDGIKLVGGDYHEGQLSERMSNPTIVADVVATWLEKGEDRPTLVFAVDRAHAALLHSEFESVGVKSAYVDANTPREERTALAARFQRGEIRVICSIGTMTTGVDLDVRCIVFARPTKSEILFVQCIGRGLRTAPGKEYVLILDHSDTHLRLGMVTDIIHDELDDGKKPKKSEVEKKEKLAPLPIECVVCSCLIPVHAIECPNCGAVPKRASSVIQLDGELVELGRGKRPKGETATDRLVAMGKQQIYGELRAVQAQLGRKDGWVGNTFRDIFGVFPRFLDDAPLEPSRELLAFIRHKDIAWAKRRKTEGADHAVAG